MIAVHRARDNREVFVNPEHILSIYPTESGSNTAICFSSNQIECVKESPEYIRELIRRG